MKRVFVILCVCLCCVLVLSACGESQVDQTPTEDGMYVPIKDDSGTVTGYERKYHNDKGDVTRWDVYTADEVYDHYILYEYDSNGRLGKETYYRADGIGVYYYAYSYTDDGTLAEKDYVTSTDGSERILYNENGDPAERYSYDYTDALTKYEVYKNGAWVEAELPTSGVDPTDS